MARAERINENTRSVREAMTPRDKITSWFDLEKPQDLKPMWDEFYAAGVEFENYVHFRYRPFEGRFVGATDGGYRRVRDQGPWPPSSSNYNVFFFGGSTAFGVGPYWATVASYLQQSLNSANHGDRPLRIYNFGRSGYFTAQEIILFQRMLTQGYVPDMAIFLDGPNDFCWMDGQPSSWQLLADYFNSVNAASQRHMAGKDLGAQWDNARKFLASLPLLRIAGAIAERLEAAPEPRYLAAAETATEEKPEPEKQLEGVIDRYVSTKRQVEAIATAFNITPVFAWQPIPTYKYDTSYHLFKPSQLGCHINSKFGYPLMAKRVERTGGLGADFIWLADMQEQAREELYVDAFHYTAPMSRQIADALAREIKGRGMLKAFCADCTSAVPAAR